MAEKVNASKEKVREALDALNSMVADGTDGPRKDVIRAVLEACERKLPTEEAYRREQGRKRAFSAKKRAAAKEGATAAG
jgi:hypothetical protein